MCVQGGLRWGMSLAPSSHQWIVCFLKPLTLKMKLPGAPGWLLLEQLGSEPGF